MRLSRSVRLSSILLAAFSSLVIAQQPASVSTLARMPVREVSVFKDGHAFVMHEGSIPTDTSGNVVMDYLPAPVMGTFWAYAADPGVRVSSVTAGQHRVVVERTALKLWELLESNIGASVIVTEKPAGVVSENLTYPATILSIPRRTSEELLATSPPNTSESLPVRGELILLNTEQGVKALPVDRIQDVVFRTPPRSLVGEQEFRNLLTLKLDWTSRAPAREAGVGIVYLQKGLRWIPSYRVAIDGKETATLKLQGVLINELTDLEGVTANLVIGVPSFAFKDTVDPLSLGPVTPLSSFFQTSVRSALSNAIYSQVAAPGLGEVAQVEAAAPQLAESSQSEDLALFTFKNVTLKKGQRMSLPVVEHKLKYKDVYTIDLPISPPPEVRANLNPDQQSEIASLLGAPRPAHKIRIQNSAAVPLTTAPALVVQDERVLSQGTMLYTPPNATGDLEIGKAVDIQVLRSETEISRTNAAVRVNGNAYSEVNLTGVIKVTNYRREAVAIEVTREVLGFAKTASHNGRIEKLNTLAAYPAWWRYYSWPYWWNQMNGIGRITWTVTLAPGQSADLDYSWQYYWQ